MLIQAAKQDLRFAWRTLRKNPGFALASICTLALGIGANTAIFSVVYASLLRPLPYLKPAELVSVTGVIPRMPAGVSSLTLRARDFDAYRRSNSVFSGIAALRSQDFSLTGEGEPERLYGARVSGSLFSMLGVRPASGRTFTPEEDTPGRDRVVVISHELWTRRFGADPDVVNRAVSLDGQAYVVIGVMPKGFLFPTGRQFHSNILFGPRVEVWKPMAFTPSDLAQQGNWAYGCIGRLKPGVSLAQARANLDAIAATEPFPDGRLTARTRIVPLSEVFSANARKGLVVLMGAVALLLLTACVNLANLLLARMSARGREFATRAALGASRRRLVRQLLTETSLIASIGAAVGLAIAYCGTRLLAALAPADLPAARSSQINGPVLLFTVAVALATGVALGLVSAFETARGDPRESLASKGTASGPRTGQLRRLLVAVEVTLSTGLLVVAGLLLHSFVNVMNVDKGFAVERVLAADLSLSGRQMPPSRLTAFHQELAGRISTLPGVVSAGIVTAPPLGAKANRGESGPVYFENDTSPSQTAGRPFGAFQSVTKGYFATMGIPFLAGRALEDVEPFPVTVISAGLARRLWPGESLQNIVGRRIKLNYYGAEPVMIVGVTGDVRAEALESDPTPAAYRPISQAPFGEVTLLVRTTQDPGAFASAIRREVGKLDRNLPVASMQTMREIVSASAAPRRFQMILIVTFGVLSLVLAVVGVYGVASYSVARRTQEIGLRMALGARQGDVLRSVLVEGLRPVLAGLALGLAAAGIAAVSIRSMLFGIEPLDSLTLVGASGALLLAAALACYVPARRAARIDPMAALRFE